MLEHDNLVSKYNANYDKRSSIWNRDMVTELFSRSWVECELQNSGIYLCATKNNLLHLLASR